MLRCRRLLAFLTAILACNILSAAQPATPPVPAAHITLGQSAVPLHGPWKFTIGDSPIDPATGKPLWAEPSFDDSRWESVDLTPAKGAVDPASGMANYVPGWTAKSHPGYSGYAWYRLRLSVDTRPGEELALAGPIDFEDAFQAFDNGTLLGGFGDFSGANPVAFYEQPTLFRLPPSGEGGPSSQPLVLAFRVWMSSVTAATSPGGVGGFHNAPVLGAAGAVADGYQVNWITLIRLYLPRLFEAVVFSMVALLAFSLILFDPADRVYLWMGAFFLGLTFYNADYCIESWTLQASEFASIWRDECVLYPFILAVFVMVWWVWFGMRRPRWFPWAVAVVAALLGTCIAINYRLLFPAAPAWAVGAAGAAATNCRLLFFCAMLWITALGIRRQWLEGSLVMLAVLLNGVSVFYINLANFGIFLNLYILNAQFTLPMLVNLISAMVIVVLLLRRLLASLKTQRKMALDVKQAQEVQQVILPEARLVLPGLTIESEYRPAREVGGDFFQIIPHKSDGSLLIVAGDVTGKGLKAGMLVALLVGAIRSTAESTADPLAMLQALNRRLLGRGDAQATCLALHIARDGAATLANAGHMAPYVNGEPLPMEGALPLGMIEGAEPSLMQFQLKHGDKLVLISDGIAEATDAEGHLFGFERVNELLRTATSAAQLASEAQTFGQEDDISVIAVTRTAALSPA